MYWWWSSITQQLVCNFGNQTCIAPHVTIPKRAVIPRNQWVSDTFRGRMAGLANAMKIPTAMIVAPILMSIDLIEYVSSAPSIIKNSPARLAYASDDAASDWVSMGGWWRDCLFWFVDANCDFGDDPPESESYTLTIIATGEATLR